MSVLGIYASILRNAMAYSVASERFRTIFIGISGLTLCVVIGRLFMSKHFSLVLAVVPVMEIILVTWCSAMLIPMLLQLRGVEPHLAPGLRPRVLLLVAAFGLGVVAMLVHLFKVYESQVSVVLVGFYAALLLIGGAITWSVRAASGAGDTANPFDAISHACARRAFARSIARASRPQASVPERLAAAMGWRLHWTASFGVVLVLGILVMPIFFQDASLDIKFGQVFVIIVVSSWVWGYMLACRVSGVAVASREELKVLSLAPAMPLSANMAAPVTRVLAGSFLKGWCAITCASIAASLVTYPDWHGLDLFFYCVAQMAFIAPAIGYAGANGGKARYAKLLVLPAILLVSIWLGGLLPKKYQLGGLVIPLLATLAFMYYSWSCQHDELGRVKEQ